MKFRITQTELEPSELPVREYELSLDTQDRAVRHLDITSLEELIALMTGAKHPLILLSIKNDELEIEIYNSHRE